MKLHIKFIKTCKTEALIPTFANVRLSFKQYNPKLIKRICRIAMEDEVQMKHFEKRNLQKDIKAISYQLRRLLPKLECTTLLYQINLAIRSRVKSIVKRHEHKLINFRQQYQTQSETSQLKVNKHIIHNFPSFVLSPEEVTALPFGLDQHIPYNVDSNSINTEFELFYQNLFQDNSHLPEQALSRIKTKLRYICEKYCKIKAPYKY